MSEVFDKLAYFTPLKYFSELELLGLNSVLVILYWITKPLKIPELSLFIALALIWTTTGIGARFVAKKLDWI